MGKNTGLSREDQQAIEQNEAAMAASIAGLDKARQFKLNDYLVATRVWGEHKKPLVNSYGTRTKFKVIHVDKNGIPYVKQVSSKGEVSGRIISLFDSFDPEYQEFEWEHDPHFVESIILAAEEGYDPTEVQRKKKELRDEITNHNAGAKVDTGDLHATLAAFQTMAQGQVWWFSVKGNIHIDSVTLENANKLGGRGNGWQYKRNQMVPKIEVTLSTGKKKSYYPHDFRHKNLYSKQPRTYKELSDTI